MNMDLPNLLSDLHFKLFRHSSRHSHGGHSSWLCAHHTAPCRLPVGSLATQCLCILRNMGIIRVPVWCDMWSIVVREKAYLRAGSNTMRNRSRFLYPPPELEIIATCVSCAQHPPYLKLRTACWFFLCSALSSS